MNPIVVLYGRGVTVMEPTNYSLIVAFDQDTPAYARGFEMGALWQRLQSEPWPVEAVVHACNAEMCVRLAEAVGVVAQSTELGDDWLSVTFR
ncbi:MAG: hypothetical protein LC808_01040 [Actinobacteria bacterium]|nr:hypothetical protein [Actinomycetota bacterium]